MSHTTNPSNGAIRHEDAKPPEAGKAPAPVPEIGGPRGPEPTRYGDWERNGRCSDF